MIRAILTSCSMRSLRHKPDKSCAPKRSRTWFLLWREKQPALSSAAEGSGRPVFGGPDPDTKLGPRAAADLRVVTPRRSRLGKRFFRAAPPLHPGPEEVPAMTRRKHSRPARDIAPVHPHAAAVDIGATLHGAAVRPGGDPEPVRTFGTFTTDLHRLADWFEQCGVETLEMESTGFYWIPLYEILDQRGFEVVVVNA